MSTKARLILSLGALTLLVFLLAGISIAAIHQLRGEGGDVLKANYMSLEYMQDMLTAMDESTDSAAQDMRSLLARQQANITEPGEAEATEALAQALSRWEQDRGDSLASQALVPRIRAILDLNRDAIVQRARIAEQRGERAVTWITLAGTLCALLALSLLFGMVELLSAPIRLLTAGIDRIAQGNYAERITIDRKDEFGHLADRFNAMAEELEKWESSNLARIMEEKVRAEAVIQSLQDASIGFDEQGKVLFANHHALELLHMTAPEVVGTSRAELAARNDLLREWLDPARTAPLKIVKDGKECFYTLEHVPILKEEERLGTVAVLRNVTFFEEKDRAKTNFLATISHELKTPLASTDIGLTLLERNATGLDAEARSILTDLRKDHQRLVRIVSELLDLTQVETGNIRIDIAEHALDPLVDDALDAVRRQGDRKGIVFQRRNGGEGLRVRGDGSKTSWVLLNILGNAVRHSPERGVITVATEMDQGRVLVTISDQGPGIPAEEAARLFQRYTPGPGAEHGTGLGLAIAREFMLAMGGDIELVRPSHEGAVFQLSFTAALGNE